MPGTPDKTQSLTLLSFDYGRRRIGVAVGQRITGSASPLGVAHNGAAGPDWQRIGRWISEWQPDQLVVGMPYNADGSRAQLAADVESFSDALSRYGLPVGHVDERYSSIEAAEQLRRSRAAGTRGRVRRETVDAAAAVLIAERWMRESDA